MTTKEKDKIQALLERWHKRTQETSYIYKRGSSNIVKAVTSSTMKRTLHTCIEELEALF